MAAGDEAAAAGLSVVPATADVRQGYAAINTRGDELARHQTSGTHPFTRITGQAQTAQIADSAVTKAKLAENSVGYWQIEAGAVTTSKIEDGAVTPAKMTKRIRCGTVTVGPGTAGVYVNTGLSGSIVMTITSRAIALGAQYAAQPTATAGQMWVRQWGGESGIVQWIAMEV